MGNTIFENPVKRKKITGTTSINHEIRVSLGLTCAEYALMDYVYKLVKKNTPLDVGRIQDVLGFNIEEQQFILNELVSKGFIFPEDTPVPNITDKWISGFKDISAEFEMHFWKKDGKVFWTGSKKQSQLKYVNARKSYSMDFLVEQRNHYAKMLEYSRLDGFDRKVMMAERWLSAANEYYLTDWKSQWEELEKSLIAKGKIKKQPTKEESKPLTEEERKKQYAEDN
jgi:hypothetical protein